MDFVAQLTALAAPPQVLDWARIALPEFVSRSQTEAEQLRAELKLRELKIEALLHELRHLKRMNFGKSSEALAANRDLFEETRAIDIAACEAKIAAEEAAADMGPHLPKPPVKRTRAGRQALPEHLERVVHVHEPESCTCGQCGGELVRIGEDVTEQLDVVPAKFFVHRHVRPKYVCRPCETVIAAPVAPAIIDGGLAAPGLHAWLVIAKYVDHLPLYRIEHIAARSDVPLARSTLAAWIGRIGVALEPLYNRLIQLLLARTVLHADETPVAQLDPGSGKTKRAYLWAYHSNLLDPDPPIVIFDYQEGRSGRFVREFLKGWRGTLMVDDYAGYKELFQNGVCELGCLAHARRKFFELAEANKCPISIEAVARIAELYIIEQRGRELAADQRLALRQNEAKPKLDAMHRWLVDLRPQIAQGGNLARAVDYSLRRWDALSRYVEDGAWPIDNNPVENAIRPIAVGKKNWLFAGSAAAGKRAAMIQSLLATARANGIEPYAWLKNTLEKLPAWPSNRLDELLPLAPRP